MLDSSFKINKMDFYYDRAIKEDYMEIADKCTDGLLFLWNKLYLDENICDGNIFFYKFEGENIKTQTVYLYSLDYLSYVLTAYKETGKEVYKNTFDKYINQFYEFIKTEGPFYDDLSVMGQILCFIKALDIVGEIPYQDYFEKLMLHYADWLADEKNHKFINNHELFWDISLLHISVLFNKHPNSNEWQNYAIECINKMFSLAYNNDYTNNENCLRYFELNNVLYSSIINFCRHYNIKSINKINVSLEKAKDALVTFAHKDGSFPIIGDGAVFYGKSNKCSQLFPDMGTAVIKINDVYLTFKAKTNCQSHAHIDVSSITARYKDIDFIIDPGQYNYDKYTPINRFLHSSAGHSGIFPLFADDMFQKEFCEVVSYSEITEYKHNEKESYVKGEYHILDIKVCREINIYENEIIIKDSWKCDNPTTMRQRFIIPKELIEHSKFTASKRMLETIVENCHFKFEIISSSKKALTEVQFGVSAPRYYEYETTMLLDTYLENSTAGEITAKITFWEE